MRENGKKFDLARSPRRVGFSGWSLPINLICVLVFPSVCHTSALAQQAPDAGQTHQQLQPRMEPAPHPNIEVPIPESSIPYTPPGGQAVEIIQIKVLGNTTITEESILESLGNFSGKFYDLAGLRDLAYQVSNHYNREGYPFVNAILPEQDLTLGILRIQVIEGKYGSVKVTSDNPKLQEQGHQWLSRLQPGTVIRKDELERTLLMLDDQSGIKTFNTLGPSEQSGASDLNVRILEETPFQARYDLDNHGNRYTGYYRVQTNLSLYNRVNLGDELALQGLYASESLLLGSLSYSSPLGTSGLGGKAGYAVTRYQLGKEFASSQASGVATELSLEMSYRFMRTQLSSWTLRGGFLKKHLRDKNISSDIGKSSVSFPITLQFYDLGSLGGGLTFGSFSWVNGELETPAAIDVLNTRGSFNKYNLNLSRLQPLRRDYTLYLNFSKQMASRNLDSSEGYSLGGAGGVRAYPSGEATGDAFWLSQIELRYLSGPYTPFLFYDLGSSRADAVASGPARSISGVGMGLRYQYSAWSAETIFAWRTHGGLPQADTSRDPSPLIWLKIAYTFS